MDRVVNDGVRNLTIPPNSTDSLRVSNIVAGLDGSVWLFLPDRFFRLGDEDQAAPGWRLFWPDADIEIAPDGHVWLIAQREDGSADLVAFVDRLLPTEDGMIWGDPAWPEYADLHYLGVEVEPDGTVRTAWFEPYSSGAPNRSMVTVGSFWGGWIPLPTVRSWPGQRDGDPVLEVGDHRIWLATDRLQTSDRNAGWRTEKPPFDPSQLDVGLDGTAWIQTMEFRIQTEEERSSGIEDVCGLGLARFDGTAWEVWGPEDGVPAFGSVHFFGGCQEGVHAAAPDGSVWLAPPDHLLGRECRGIVNSDGTSWNHYLDGTCVYDAEGDLVTRGRCCEHLRVLPTRCPRHRPHTLHRP